MASIFSTPDEARCRHYARFASHLDRAHFDIIYWLLFTLVILMLCMASARYMSTMEAVTGDRPRSQSYNSKLKACMIYCSAFTVISVVAVVLEVFVLMALQFCDGEDLMSIYWATWTMLQVGSLIAVFGILLHISHMMRGRKNPPWALALGTPVLVVAGLGHLISSAMNKRVKSVRAKSLGGHKSSESVEGVGITQTAYPKSSGEEEKTDDDKTTAYDARLADKIRLIKASIGEQDLPSRHSSRRKQPGPEVSKPSIPPVATREITAVEQQPPVPPPSPFKTVPLQTVAATQTEEVKPTVYPLAARQADSPSRVSYPDLPLPEDGYPASLSLPTLGSSLQGHHSQQGSRRNSSAHRRTD